jgi:hypothetical protein
MHETIASQLHLVGAELRDSVCVATASCDVARALLLPRLDTGSELEQIVARGLEGSGLELRDRLQVFRGLASTLDMLHSLPVGVSQGDAKAKNVILVRGRPVLIDFELSSVLTPDTRAGLVEGDAKQLLWVALQLLFCLPFKSGPSGLGVMSQMDDGGWDLTPSVYRRAGPLFDRLLDGASNSHGATRRRLTVGDVRDVVEGMFAAAARG